MTNDVDRIPMTPRSARFSVPVFLLAAIVAVGAAALPKFTLAGDQAETKQIANPIDQRNEMIQVLKSIDGRLAEIKEILAQKN